MHLQQPYNFNYNIGQKDSFIAKQQIKVDLGGNEYKTLVAAAAV
jgi:hypothetical protein